MLPSTSTTSPPTSIDQLFAEADVRVLPLFYDYNYEVFFTKLLDYGNHALHDCFAHAMLGKICEKTTGVDFLDTMPGPIRRGFMQEALLQVFQNKIPQSPVELNAICQHATRIRDTADNLPSPDHLHAWMKWLHQLTQSNLNCYDKYSCILYLLLRACKAMSANPMQLETYDVLLESLHALYDAAVPPTFRHSFSVDLQKIMLHFSCLCAPLNSRFEPTLILINQMLSFHRRNLDCYEDRADFLHLISTTFKILAAYYEIASQSSTALPGIFFDTLSQIDQLSLPTSIWSDPWASLNTADFSRIETFFKRILSEQSTEFSDFAGLVISVDLTFLQTIKKSFLYGLLINLQQNNPDAACCFLEKLLQSDTFIQNASLYSSRLLKEAPMQILLSANQVHLQQLLNILWSCLSRPIAIQDMIFPYFNTTLEKEKAIKYIDFIYQLFHTPLYFQCVEKWIKENAQSLWNTVSAYLTDFEPRDGKESAYFMLAILPYHSSRVRQRWNEYARKLAGKISQFYENSLGIEPKDNRSAYVAVILISINFCSFSDMRISECLAALIEFGNRDKTPCLNFFYETYILPSLIKFYEILIYRFAALEQNAKMIIPFLAHFGQDFYKMTRNANSDVQKKIQEKFPSLIAKYMCIDAAELFPEVLEADRLALHYDFLRDMAALLLPVIPEPKLDNTQIAVSSNAFPALPLWRTLLMLYPRYPTEPDDKLSQNEALRVTFLAILMKLAHFYPAEWSQLTATRELIAAAPLIREDIADGTIQTAIETLMGLGFGKVKPFYDSLNPLLPPAEMESSPTKK